MEIQSIINEHVIPIIILGSGGSLLLALSVIFFFARFRQRAQQQKEFLLRTELAYKEQLLQSSIRTQEEERVRISKDLHDHVGSTLSNMRFLVNRFDGLTPGTEAMQSLTGEYKEMIDGVIKDVREISHELAPPGLAIWGLYETIEALCEKTGRSAPFRITVSGNSQLKDLSFDHALAIYRVVQELINNTLKHAAATEVTIAITETPQDLKIIYHDNGRGALSNPAGAGGMGIGNMESRIRMIGGTALIETALGKGFSYTITVPHGITNNTQ